MLPCGVTKPAASELPNATPSTALSFRAMEPASAVTSPSLTTSKGTPFQAVCRSKKRRRMLVSNWCWGAARQVGGGAPQGIVDAVVVILRIALHGGVPGHLVAENDFAFDDGGALAVAGAQVEADAAAIQVASEGGGGF